ncbi:MAG: class III lanthionine synthetase LanKC [Trebonia sp.]
MDKQYEQYCLAHPLFYDSLQSGDQRRYFPVARRPLPLGWRRTAHGDWMTFQPPGTELPHQGWKIHASACPENADNVLHRIWKYCVAHGIHFKIISSPFGVRARNLKYAPREASGKAATIYPADDTECEQILRELDAELSGSAGPYILSDLRYGAGPFYVRYGGFTERFCLDSGGRMAHAIENAAGDLVPDVRSPVFSVPDWVQVPLFLGPHLAARNSVGLADMDYTVTGALHFSNGGGVYTGTDKRDGSKVILKEARPHAGLAADGSDAVARLRRERDLMGRLSGLGIAPEVRTWFEAGDHHFLVEDFIEGRTLSSFFAERYPLIMPDPDAGEIASYTSWAVRVCADTERAARLMHERDIVFNDLHPFNVMVRPDDTVAFIDFEAASDIGEGRHVTVGNPGFAAPRDRTGFEVDAYSLACLRLSVFMPLTTLIPLDRAKAAQLAGEIAAIFPVPDGFLDDAVTEIDRAARAASSVPGQRRGRGSGQARTPWSGQARRPGSGHARRPGSGQESIPETGGTADELWPRVRAGLVTAIQASATPQRQDRLFPGDIDQFRVTAGGASLAYGAAGVLYALDEAAGTRVPEYEEWLIKRARTPQRGTPLGFYDGLAGVAWTLARLGHHDAAARIAGMCLTDKWERLGHGLFDGLAGFGLAMLDLAGSAGEPAFGDAGLRAAEIVADAVRGDRMRGGGMRGGAPRVGGSAMGSAGKQGEQVPAGLMHGAAGKALLFLRAFERTGDTAWLDAAQAALAADLRQCVPDRKGGLQVNEGWRVLPYLKSGSAGIGLVIGQFLPYRPDATCDGGTFAEAAGQIAVAASAAYYAQPGLFSGRAGLLCLLVGRDRTSPRVHDHVTRLAWHAVPYEGGLAFPGDMLLRLSMDLGTGTAGVLLSLAAALAPRGAGLPFFRR